MAFLTSAPTQTIGRSVTLIVLSLLVTSVDTPINSFPNGGGPQQI